MSTIAALDVSRLPDTPFMREAKQKATELEGVFLNTLVSQMMSGLDARSGFGGGQAEETWRSMQSEYLADSIAQSGGIGLADDILSSLLQQQEALFTPSANPASAETPS